jgi:hypothetical protein
MEKETKQTAVEWVWLNLDDDLIGDLSPEKILKIYQLIVQAKEMEKEQTIKTALFWSHSTVKRKDIEDYYNETYGGNK